MIEIMMMGLLLMAYSHARQRRQTQMTLASRMLVCVPNASLPPITMQKSHPVVYNRRGLDGGVFGACQETRGGIPRLEPEGCPARRILGRPELDASGELENRRVSSRCWQGWPSFAYCGGL